MYATSASDSPGRSSTSVRSPATWASKISRWLFEPMYSPAAIEKTPASAAAMPATMTANGSPVAPATVATTASVETMPSCAPNTTSRASPSRALLRRSSARCAAIQSRGYAEAGADGAGRSIVCCVSAMSVV